MAPEKVDEGPVSATQVDSHKNSSMKAWWGEGFQQVVNKTAALAGCQSHSGSWGAATQDASGTR